MHDFTTLEPTHEEIFAFLRELHTSTPMDPSHDDSFALYDHLGELVLSPMFQIVIWRFLGGSHDMRDHEKHGNCRFLICLNMSLMRANH